MERMPGHPTSLHCSVDATTKTQSIGAQSHGRTWYLSKEEMEEYSPSRIDGIDYMQESFMRELYCSFLEDLALKLEVGSVTLATALMLCHRFFMRQSLAKNDWQLIATSSMFLACKIEEKIHTLKNIAVVAYEITYKWDPSAPRRIKQRDVLFKQMELILDGERLILVTIAFDINIEHPYEPLMTALKMLKLSENHVARTAWDFVSYGLRSTLCMLYKPHYLAAASLFIAAKLKNVKLPMDGENVWWLKFNVTPKRLQEAIKDMHIFLKQRKERTPVPRHSKSKIPKNSQSCIPSGSTVTRDDSVVKHVETERGDVNLVGRKQASEHIPSDCSSANSVVEDSEATCWTNAKDSRPETQTGHGELDVAHLEELCRKIRSENNSIKRKVETSTKELELGIDRDYGHKVKQQKVQ